MSPIRKEVTIGSCRLILGDCLEVLPTLGPVDAVVTDPPYGIDLGVEKDMRGGTHGLAKQPYASYEDTFGNFVGKVVPALNVAIEAARRAAIFTGHHIHEQRKPDALGGIYCPAANARHCWGFKSFLPILLYGTAPNLNLGSKATALYSTETVDRREIGHPVPKPLGWMKWMVDLASLDGETVLDPFMGSGTTGVACVKLGRKFIGIEIDEGYFNIACERIRKAYAQPDMFIEPRAPEPVQEALL